MALWFRMYNEVLDDPKVQRLSGELFKAWVNLLCLAARNGGALPAPDDIAFSLRVNETKSQAIVIALVDAGLLDKTQTAVKPHNWGTRQFEGDVSTPRVKKFRERLRKRDETVSETINETPPDTEAETETEPERVEGAPPSASPLPSDVPRETNKTTPLIDLGREPETEDDPQDIPEFLDRRPVELRTKGKHLEDDWKPDDADRQFAANAGFDVEQTDAVADRFRDYWIGISGQKGVKRDWHATWRNWVRSDAEKRGASGPRNSNAGAGQRHPTGIVAALDRVRTARENSGSDDERVRF